MSQDQREEESFQHKLYTLQLEDEFQLSKLEIEEKSINWALKFINRNFF